MPTTLKFHSITDKIALGYSDGGEYGLLRKLYNNYGSSLYKGYAVSFDTANRHDYIILYSSFHLPFAGIVAQEEITADNYGWIWFSGVCLIKAQDTIGVDGFLQPKDGDGAVNDLGVTWRETSIGRALQSASKGDLFLADLKINH